MLFSTGFQVASGGLSQGTMVVDLSGAVAPDSAFTEPPLQLVASVNPGESVTPQLMNPDGTLTDFNPTPGLGVVVISIQRQSIAGTDVLLDLSLVQQPNILNGLQSATRWTFRGTATHNFEQSFRGGGGGLDFAGISESPLSIQNGPQSDDGVVVSLLCSSGVTGLVELVANVPPRAPSSPSSRTTMVANPLFRIFPPVRCSACLPHPFSAEP